MPCMPRACAFCTPLLPYAMLAFGAQRCRACTRYLHYIVTLCRHARAVPCRRQHRASCATAIFVPHIPICHAIPYAPLFLLCVTRQPATFAAPPTLSRALYRSTTIPLPSATPPVRDATCRALPLCHYFAYCATATHSIFNAAHDSSCLPALLYYTPSTTLTATYSNSTFRILLLKRGCFPYNLPLYSA